MSEAEQQQDLGERKKDELKNGLMEVTNGQEGLASTSAAGSTDDGVKKQTEGRSDGQSQEDTFERKSPQVLTAADVDAILGSQKSPSAEETKANEETKENGAVASTSNDTSNEEEDATLENIPFQRTTFNRVKLYVLCEQKAWEDKGTGHVSCMPMPNKPNEWYLIVRLEDEDKNILESKILDNTKYNRQQGTLIVWNESETVDLALSFQEKQGCEELFQEIQKVQSVDGAPARELDDDNESDSNESAVSTWSSSFTLPPCDLLHITEIESLISSSLSSASSREVIANALCRGDYLTRLCEMFEMAEDLDDESTLASMAAISKDMFLLNNQALLTEMINEKHFRHFVGMLEYDPAVKKPKKHREFLFEKAQFREVLPLSNQELKEKITETFRLQYVQDICLPAPSIFEENLLAAISGNIFFNRVEIVSQLMNDKEILKQLFSELKQTDIAPQRQKDLTCFLKEFCTFAQSLQPNGQQGRETFFKVLMQNDVFQILDPCMSSSIPLTQAMTVELLGMIVDFALKTFREFLTKQDLPEDQLLLNKMFHYMMYDRDPEFTNARNMAEVMRVLLEPESPSAIEYEEFFAFFYKKCMPSLVKPIKDLTVGGRLVRDDYYTCRQVCMILTILVFCIKNHESLMRMFIIQNDLLSSVVVLLKSKHHLTCLKAVRLVRRIIDLRDEVYFRYIKEKKVFKPIVAAFNANGPRYNMLNSCFLDLFEFIQHENIITLIDYIGSEHMAELEHVDYVKTFVNLKRKYENRKEEQNRKDDHSAPSTPIKNLPDRLQSQYDRERRYDEDEQLFDDDDEVRNENNMFDDEQGPLRNKRGFSLTPMRKSGSEPMFPSVAKRKKNGEEEGIASIFGGSVSTPSITNRPSKITIKMGGSVFSPSVSPVKDELPLDAVIKTIPLRKSSLVDYEDSDSDDENEIEKARSAPASVFSSPRSSDILQERGSDVIATTSEATKSPLKRTDSGSPVNGDIGSRKRVRSLEDEDSNTEKRPRSESPKKDHRHMNGYSTEEISHSGPSISPQSCSAEAANESTSGLGKRISFSEDNREDEEKLIQVELDGTPPASTPPRSPATTA